MNGDIYDYLKNPNINNFFTSPTSKEEVFGILKELDPTKAGYLQNITQVCY